MSELIMEMERKNEKTKEQLQNVSDEVNDFHIEFGKQINNLKRLPVMEQLQRKLYEEGIESQ